MHNDYAFLLGYVITNVEMEHLYVLRINNSNSVVMRAYALYSLQTLNEVDNGIIERAINLLRSMNLIHHRR